MSTLPVPTPERSILEKIFISGNERRLRAGWRLLIHTILLILLVIGFSIPYAVITAVARNIPNEPWFFFFSELVLFLGVTIATFLTRRFIDKRSITSLGLVLNRWTILDISIGIVIASLTIGSIYLAELALGWTSFDSFAWQSESTMTVVVGILPWLFTFLLAGWAEELLSRGYHLQNIAEGLNPFWGVLISSSIFGLLHIANENASWVSTLGIVLAGFFLALPYLLTRQLWLSIGLHIGWNIFEGVVFGFPVSGMTTYNLLRHTVTGPELWTGGAFGPEAGLLLIPAMVLGAGLIYGYTKLRPEQSKQSL
jgi:membrane protease YdiL (CAAX protease family)